MSALRSLTAAQIISQGDYLDADFDPAALTVPQLLGILGYHNIRFPTPYTKPKLLQLFLDEIRPKATKFRKERLKRENSIASDDGITDGITGEPINGKGTSARRSSRRLPRRLEDANPIQPSEPVKRRRSAQPILGSTSTGKAGAVQPTVAEESEPDEEMPVRTLHGSKEVGSTALLVSTTCRRGQQEASPGVDDSGWEDNNIFQSGAESSSPARPDRANKGRRKSVRRKSRHSMSAPPQFSPPSSPPKPTPLKYVPQSPSPSKLAPPLPPSVPQPQLPSPSHETLVSRPSTERGFIPNISLDESFIHDRAASGVDIISARDGIEVATVSQESGLADRSQLSTRRPKSRSYLLTLFYAICLVVGSTIVIKFKNESEAIGYCDTGSNTNRALEEFQARLSTSPASEQWNRTISNFLSALIDGISREDGTPSPPLALIPLPHPSRCTPCPESATCTQHTVTCNPGYILRPHPVLALLSPFGTVPPPVVQRAWNFISKLADGLPGLGPVAFPPSCIEDPKRKRNIGALGRAIEALLGQERGRRVCAGGLKDQVDAEGGEARKWGLEIEVLREVMKHKTAPHLLETFDDTFNEAIQQLTEWGSVIFGQDMSGSRYLAHKMANMTLTCQITVKVRELWLRWRGTLFACFVAYCALYILRRSRAQRQIETKRVAELVQITLDTLRNQELAHHADPVTAPQAYLSSVQLRDLILQGEHSISARRRLWDQVERVVEGNANVRANLEEVQAGDELRVWRWVGTAGRGPEQRKRVRTEVEKGDEPIS
ncbi:hypothetical protein PISMIDRAFT_85430 [Pisolithus microcarpus 441]|uniref:Inner nuclear membrane protein MAN1 n=1 Tax=Pisolithus microcarpus 441 TaxID=765257 RepID=A0A0C9ZZ20_9AGAM|nr:hypothetical protein PISMIDRAFT_85430 [Pisolithus microcarpus 441]